MLHSQNLPVKNDDKHIISELSVSHTISALQQAWISAKEEWSDLLLVLPTMYYSFVLH